ncbi:flagellar basal body-associated FliL family protein [Roseovarius ramblicola]|uniref:Flagellar basal body-associated FliL family protein n=1 Tax=Roseovarius ramblicola TaxID=2022336 RepID=A0ABV5HVT6_9RHOB
MMRFLLPVLMAIAGAGAGVGAGLLLVPAPAAPPGDTAATPATDTGPDTAPDTGPSDFIGLNNQFIVPILEDERIGAMVVLSLSIEVVPGNAEAVYAREPKLRDGFLQVLFDHANRGGFDGEFTNADSMDVLRRMLSEVARDLLGEVARRVLITAITRQDT